MPAKRKSSKTPDKRPDNYVALSTYTLPEVKRDLKVYSIRNDKAVCEVVTEALKQYLKGKQ